MTQCPAIINVLYVLELIMENCICSVNKYYYELIGWFINLGVCVPLSAVVVSSFKAFKQFRFAQV